MANASEIEFSFLVPADTIGTAPKNFRIVADEMARDALARRFGLVTMDSLIAEISVCRIVDSALIAVSGSLSVVIIQACVVSGEPVAASINETISHRFGPPDQIGAESDFDMDDEDPPEPIIADSIELGELLVQNLAVSIDPYPRARDAAPHPMPGIEDGFAKPPVKRPFASLAALKKKQT